MKCKHCGAEIIRIRAMGGTVICWASPTAYWTVRDKHARGLYTPNGISISGNLTGDPQRAVGIGYLPHTCNQKPIILKGRDSWSRPVYEELSGRLLVDVDPRKDREPDICTKQENAFDGEPCDSVEKGRQDLYLHPLSFSGVMDEADIEPLLEQLSKAQTFNCYHLDRYEEYLDMSDEEYRAALEAKRGEITDFILDQCRTKRSNLYITDPVAVSVAEEFDIRPASTMRQAFFMPYCR